jgi:putative endonuclease
LYTGYAVNIEDRIRTHNCGKGAKYTRSRLPVELIAQWSFESKSLALQEEMRIKKLSRSDKLSLSQSYKP